MAEPPLDRDRLRRLTERLDLAAQRAEQLLSESVLAAAASEPHPPSPDPDATMSDPDTRHAPSIGPDGDPVRAADSHPRRPPPSGWRQPPLNDRSDRDHWLDSDELELLMAVLAGIRDRIPAELRQRLAEAIRELLMAFRALLDWYLERTDRPARADADVEDIPIL